jgi:hypothetical protein
LEQDKCDLAACNKELFSAREMLQSQIKKYNDTESALAVAESNVRLLTVEAKQLRSENQDLQNQRCQPPPKFSYDSGQHPGVTMSLLPEFLEDTGDEVATRSWKEYVALSSEEISNDSLSETRKTTPVQNLAAELAPFFQSDDDSGFENSGDEVKVEERSRDSEEDNNRKDHYLTKELLSKNNLAISSQEVHDVASNVSFGILEPMGTKTSPRSPTANTMPLQLHNRSPSVSDVQPSSGLPKHFSFTFTLPHPRDAQKPAAGLDQESVRREAGEVATTTLSIN